MGCRYRDLIRAVFSIKKLSDAPAYQARVYGDFGLNEYLKVGASGNQELQDFCFKALKLEFLNPKAEKFDHGGSGFYAKTPEGDYILAINYDTYLDQQLPVVIQTDANTKGSSGVKANDDRLVMVDFTIPTAVLNQAKM